LSLDKLYEFIDKEKREVLPTSISIWWFYKKYSVPVSAFILTIIAVSVSYKKRRGGMGMNLTIGIAIAFGYVFFDKIFGTLAENLLFTIVGSMVPILFSEY
jgi:lipopolysaccharide export system permease protein